MSTVELKEKLIKKIRAVKEDYILEELLSIIESEKDKEVVFNIPDEHKPGIEEGMAQVKSGRLKSHEDVMKDLRSCH